VSVYQVQKLIWEVDRDRELKRQFREDPESVLGRYDLSDQERQALRDVDAWALRSMNVHPILMRQYTRLFHIPHGEIFSGSPHRPLADGQGQ
jgi:hypothetical protein